MTTAVQVQQSTLNARKQMLDRQMYGQFTIFYSSDLDDLITNGTVGTPPVPLRERLLNIDAIADVQMDNALPHGNMELRYTEGFFSAKLMYAVDET